MKVFRGVTALPKKKYPHPVVAIGVFDGLHCAHQQLIRSIVQKAKKIHGTSMVLTFWPHPVHLLHPKEKLPLITSLAHRIRLIKDLGVDVCVVIPFTRRFSYLSPERFIHNYLVDKIHPAEVVVGNDFRFGKNRSGSLDIFYQWAKKYGFLVTAMEAERKRGEKVVSSSRIREHIQKGRLSAAARLLGRCVSILGRVMRGDRRGKMLGYPTANIYPAVELLPPHGVYLVNVHLNNQIYLGLANIGTRPSFKKNARPNLEVHLLDFNASLYGREILIEFIKKIRNEKKYSSPQGLISQIRLDEQKARRWFSRNKKNFKNFA